MDRFLGRKFALVVLNAEDEGLLETLLARAQLVVCADGGANRVYDSKANSQPTAIVGDLDSIRADVRSFFADKGCRIVDMSHDQDSTDAQKCLQFLVDNHRPSSADEPIDLVMYPCFSGRLDQQLALLHLCYIWGSLKTEGFGRLILLSSENAAIFVPKGRTVIDTSNFIGAHCGIFPLAGPAIISTSGLEWNGGQI